MLLCFVSAVAAAGFLRADPPSPDDVSAAARPLVIAHRGASGVRPEHTLAAYRRALNAGADFIEPDLVLTKDKVLIARHENLLAEVQLDEAGQPALDEGGRPLVTEATTDVAERAEFRDRLTVKEINGRAHGGWFSEDFTLEEIKTLYARERMPTLRPLNTLYAEERVPTLKEIVALVRDFEAANGFAAGLYIETKQPTYFLYEGRHLDGEAIATDSAHLLLDTLRAEGFTDPGRLFLQSFELEALRRFDAEQRRHGLEIPLVQLFGDLSNRFYRAAPYDIVFHARAGHDLAAIYGALPDVLANGVHADFSYADLVTPAALAYLATVVSGIGPAKHNVLEIELAEEARDADGDGVARQRAVLTGRVGAFMTQAREAGLLVHPYTLRAEEPFLVRDGERVLPVMEEALRLLEAGASGFFIDQPDEGRAAVEAFLTARAASRSG